MANTCSRAVAAADRRARLERAQRQPVQVGGGAQRRVGGVEHLEPAVAAEPVDLVGGHPPAGPVGRVQQRDVQAARAEQRGGPQPGQPGADDRRTSWLVIEPDRRGEGVAQRAVPELVAGGQQRGGLGPRPGEHHLLGHLRRAPP